MRGFSRALDHGDKALRWEPLDSRTAARYFDSFCMFFDWLRTQPGFERHAHPNPLVEHEMTPRERAADHARSLQGNMLHHLYPLTKRGKGIRMLRKYPHGSRWDRRSSVPGLSADQPTAGWAPVGLHLNDYIKLVKGESEPRNLLLWLMLGAGAARISEALQVFASDIFYDSSTHEALVALANPVKGKVLLTGNRAVERRQYPVPSHGILDRHARVVPIRATAAKSPRNAQSWLHLYQGQFLRQACWFEPRSCG